MDNSDETEIKTYKDLVKQQQEFIFDCKSEFTKLIHQIKELKQNQDIILTMIEDMDDFEDDTDTEGIDEDYDEKDFKKKKVYNTNSNFKDYTNSSNKPKIGTSKSIYSKNKFESKSLTPKSPREKSKAYFPSTDN